MKEIFTQYWYYLTLASACRNDIFDILEENNYSKSELISKIKTDKRISLFLINFLLNENFLFIENNYLKPTEKGKQFTENHTKSIKYSCILWSEEHLTAWQNIDYTLKTGTSAFENIYHQNFFDFIADKPDKLKIYHKAMYEYARDDYANICDIIDFSDYNSIMDIGGGLGALIENIAKKYLDKKCYLLEKQEVLDLVDEKKNFKKVAGNFFEAIPKLAELTIISRVLHDWNDDLALEILYNIKNSLPSHGRLLVIENFADKIPDNANLLSLNMAIMTESFERTKKEYEDLLTKSGFKLMNIFKQNDFQWIMDCKLL